MVNTNNNRNNNNNNDFQASLGAVNTNQQSSQATQSTTTMTMITVTPIGIPIVVPIGKTLLQKYVGIINDLEDLCESRRCLIWTEPAVAV